MLGIDLAWLGVLLGINLQTSFDSGHLVFRFFICVGPVRKVSKQDDLSRCDPFICIQLIGLMVVYFWGA